MGEHDSGTARSLQVRVYELGREPGDDLSMLTSAEQRLSMVTVLSRRMWALTGKPLPTYRRSEMPGRVIRPG